MTSNDTNQINNLDTHDMAKHTWGWETHAVNILSLNAVHYLGLIVTLLIVTVYTKCCLIIRRGACVHLLNIGSEVFTTPGAFGNSINGNQGKFNTVKYLPIAIN